MYLVEWANQKINKFMIRHWDEMIKANGGVIAVTIDNPRLGFFAHLNVVIRLLREADERNVAAIIRCESNNYQDIGLGANWLAYFFESRRDPPARPRKFARIGTHRDLGLSRPDDLGLQDARNLLFRHFAIKQSILEECEDFCSINAISNDSLAVHYRGTDKVTEAPRVAYRRILDVVEQTLLDGSHDRVFLATDEEAFVAEAIARLGQERVLFHNFARSSSDVPLHLGANRSHVYEMGRSALLDCLTLSRCGSIVRTASLLSSWASIFNPSIKVTLLSTAHDDCAWWPERVIASTSARIAA